MNKLLYNLLNQRLDGTLEGDVRPVQKQAVAGALRRGSYQIKFPVAVAKPFRYIGKAGHFPDKSDCVVKTSGFQDGGGMTPALARHSSSISRMVEPTGWSRGKRPDSSAAGSPSDEGESL